MALLTSLALSLLLAPSPPDEAADQARSLFDEAAIRYQTSDYLAAVETYTEAYRLSFEIKDDELRGRVQAAILFNLARAHFKAYGLDEKPEHLRQVVDLLEKYLDQTADLADQLDAEELLESARGELSYLEAQQSEAQDAPVAPASTTSNEDVRPKKGLEAAGYTLLGLGVASGGAAITGVVLAESAREDFAVGPTLADRNRAASLGDTANLLIIAGSASAGALIVTGAILAATGRKRRLRAQPSAWLAPGSAGLSLGGQF
jgi:tetratricopeptide (TPR) repeat protein